MLFDLIGEFPVVTVYNLYLQTDITEIKLISANFKIIS